MSLLPQTTTRRASRSHEMTNVLNTVVLEKAKGHSAVMLDPVAKVLPKFLLEDGGSLRWHRTTSVSLSRTRRETP